MRAVRSHTSNPAQSPRPRGRRAQRVGVRQRDGATDRAGFGVDPVTEANGQRAESERLVVE